MGVAVKASVVIILVVVAAVGCRRTVVAAPTMPRTTSVALRPVPLPGALPLATATIRAAVGTADDRPEAWVAVPLTSHPQL